MPLQIHMGPDTEAFSEEITRAVRSALGTRAEVGDWLLMVQRRSGGFMVDLTNRNGLMCQWLLEPGDPIAAIIGEALRGPS
jgi:hypothetical protein